ncbi:4Fe-4S binding protein [Pollutimonas bauzanensis]|uniref:4Fe-4S binding domain-containing protein n=1 Tax=Pollutimonas bauzanensis TaxID=658167 RepID=A0A1M5Y7J4_9BURK|nr:4Fe-4S binding protein [Pollutimonas bauzanensis]SHI08055.1 4Fe-4S binding domain-containing protein [Pollutimonas bauzanensis]
MARSTLASMARAGKPGAAGGWDARLRRVGDTLQRGQTAIRIAQWLFVAIYLTLLLAPALAPLWPAHEQMLARVALMAEILFWGVWWPLVILSMMLVGQFWCGLLCPDGTLTEFASRRGLARKIPAWMRRGALPIVLFAMIVSYEHIAGSRHSHGGTLLVLGSMSLAALATGLLYGRGKRVWCRYVCPTGGVFSLLARCAALHFKVDREAWDSALRPVPRAVDCPPLLDVRRLISNEKCNMCGRCSGHRDAVALSRRPPGHEIATLRREEVRLWEAAGILFVLIGLFYAGVHWPASVWFGRLNASAAGALARLGAADTVPPWWLFEARPGIAASWSALFSACASVLAMALALGAAVALPLFAAARGQLIEAGRLVYGLLPLAGLGLFLGALEHSFVLLRGAGITLEAMHVYGVRAVVLTAGVGWSSWLGIRLLSHDGTRRGRWMRGVSFACYGMAILLLASAYQWAPITPMA